MAKEYEMHIEMVVMVTAPSTGAAIGAALAKVAGVDFEWARARPLDELPDVDPPCECGKCAACITREEHDGEPDDDPVCVCGVSRSEHALCGCPEGFQSPVSWEAEKRFIAGLDEWEFERIYGDGY